MAYNAYNGTYDNSPTTLAGDIGNYSFDDPGYAGNTADPFSLSKPIVSGWYNQYLGREGSDQEYVAQTGGGVYGPSDPRMENVRASIERSPEANGYKSVSRYQRDVDALNSEQDPIRRAQIRDGLSRSLFSELKANGHDVSWQGDQLVVDGRLYNVAGASESAPAPAPSAASSAPAASRSWAPVDPLTNLTFENAFASGRPYEFGGLDSLGPVDPETENLVLSILKNPESLSPQMVETLKARSKDELAQMQSTREGDLVNNRLQLGYRDDSPFFRAERDSTRRDYDKSLVDSNRTVDINAAETNAADQRSAADLGLSFTNQRTGRQVAGENLKQGAASSRQAATSLAGQLALSRAGLLTDDRQFDATYDLQKVALQHQIDQDLWARYYKQFEGV